MDEQLVVKYIKTKNKVRKIVTYRECGELRRYHEAVVKYLNSNVSNSIFAKAYVPKSSIYKNAHAHMYNDIFLKMDIKDFFPSINHKKLAECLYFEINKKTSISRKECYDIVRKCSVGNKGLPLGLVSSPALANLYLKEFDGLLYGRIRNIGLNNPIYTRYADDMIISFKSVPDYEEKSYRKHGDYHCEGKRHLWTDSNSHYERENKHQRTAHSRSDYHHIRHLHVADVGGKSGHETCR